VQHWTQGLGRLASALIGGYLANRASQDNAAASEAVVRGASARPWVNPDTGDRAVPVPGVNYATGEGFDGAAGNMRTVPTAKAGGYEGALAALSDLRGNPYAGRLARDLMTRKMDMDIAREETLADRAAALEAAKDLRMSPQWQGDPDFVRQFKFAQTPEGGSFQGGYEDFVGRIASSKQGPTAPIQNFGFRADLVKAYGENSEQVRRFDNYVRQNPWLNLGDVHGLPDPSRPGQLLGQISTGIKPERSIDEKGERIVIAPAVPGEGRGTPTQVPAGGVNPPSPIGGAAPAGGAPTIVDLPPGRKERETKAEEKAQKKTYGDVVTADIDRSMALIENATVPVTGLGSVLSFIPGTDAHNVARLTDTIKANVGFDRLQAMRASSPTGGALGQVTDFENRLLQATIGNLEQSQSKDQLLYNLRRVKDTYLDIVHGPGNRPKEGSNKPKIDPGLLKYMTPEEKALFQ
jgi:hypothetical protein